MTTDNLIAKQRAALEELEKALKWLPREVAQRICEIPGRNSPEDQPEMCLVTVPEILNAVTNSCEEILIEVSALIRASQEIAGYKKRITKLGVAYIDWKDRAIQAKARIAALEAEKEKAEEKKVGGDTREIIIPPGLNENTIEHLIRFAQALAIKLHKAEKKYGYSDGWLTADWQDECHINMHEHIAKGDPRDVANYCMFMWARGWSTAISPRELANEGYRKNLAEQRDKLVIELTAANARIAALEEERDSALTDRHDLVADELAALKHDIARATATNVELTTELEEAQPNVARYQWLKGNVDADEAAGENVAAQRILFEVSATDWDVAIDAQLAWDAADQAVEEAQKRGGA